MSNIETLKKELLLQKEAVETKGGTVSVKNTNPSPSEITAGINSINCPDLTLATAGVNDVLNGKTFYAQNSTLKTGALISVTDEELLLKTYDYTRDTDTTIYYSLPDEVTTLRPYFLQECPYPCVVTFNAGIKEIGEYAFYNSNCTFTNFNDLTELQTVNAYAFYGIATKVDISNVHSVLTYIGDRAFYRAFDTDLCTSINLSADLTYLGEYSLGNKSATYFDSIEFNNAPLTQLKSYALYYNRFDCDLYIPETVTNVAKYFNYGGCFNNIYVPSSVTSLDSYCFGGSSIVDTSSYILQTLNFESTEPPAMSSYAIDPHYKNDTFVGIFVPDEAVEAYQASSSFANYTDLIKPMSEHP